MFLKTLTEKYTPDCSAQIKQLKEALGNADAVVIGAGSGLSSAAGFAYSGERFDRYFSDFAKKYGCILVLNIILAITGTITV